MVHEGDEKYLNAGGRVFHVVCLEAVLDPPTLMAKYRVRPLDTLFRRPMVAFENELYNHRHDAELAAERDRARKEEQDETAFRQFASRYKRDLAFARWFDEKYADLAAEEERERF